MSFDIYLQGFSGGDAAPGDGAAAMTVLDPLIVERDAKGWAVIRTGDGNADVYGIDTPDSGLMCNHVGGRTAWDVIYSVAAAARFVVMPVGRGTLLVDETMRRELPVGIPEPVLPIRSGADILSAIETAD